MQQVLFSKALISPDKIIIVLYCKCLALVLVFYRDLLFFLVFKLIVNVGSSKIVFSQILQHKMYAGF